VVPAGRRGIVVSTAAIVPSWSDAWAGAIVNVGVAAAVIVGVALEGPLSLRVAYDRDATLALAAARPSAGVVTEADLATLPPAVQRHLRLAGVVGQPRPHSMTAVMHGRIRSGPASAWMPIVARQVTTFDPPVRLFYFDATMAGVAAPGYHRFAGGAASMLVKMLGLVPVAHDSGPVMTRSETVTFLNDLCLMAPAGLIGAPIEWVTVDDRHVRATYTLGTHTVTATLAFGADGRLADFWSDDRGRATSGGTIDGQRWSTPVTTYAAFGPLTLSAGGVARWHDPAGPYAYIELSFDDITMNGSRP